MKPVKLATYWATVILILTCVGCSIQPPQSYDYSALIDSKPTSIVIIPPINHSVEINAPYILFSTLSKPLAENGYYVFPVAVIDRMFKENGLPTPSEMNNVSLAKIREIIGADAALYITIKEWGQKYQIITSRAVVKYKLSLVDTQTGALLWESTAHANDFSDNIDDSNSLLGAMVGALIEQITHADNDKTFGLSKIANDNAIFDINNGLLSGPYRHNNMGIELDCAICLRNNQP